MVPFCSVYDFSNDKIPSDNEVIGILCAASVYRKEIITLKCIPNDKCIDSDFDRNVRTVQVKVDLNTVSKCFLWDKWNDSNILSMCTLMKCTHIYRDIKTTRHSPGWLLED